MAISVQTIIQSAQPIGYTGSAGIGYTGSRGATGFTGSAGTGYTGSQGTAGFTGSQGAIGYTGSAGTGGGSSVTASDTAPVAPANNALWWDSTVGQLKIYYNDGTSAQWVDASSSEPGTSSSGTSITTTIVSGTSVTAVKDYRYILANTASTTVTLPASPTLGDSLYVVVANGLANNVIGRNSSKIMGLDQDLTLDVANVATGLVFTNSTLGWRII